MKKIIIKIIIIVSLLIISLLLHGCLESCGSKGCQALKGKDRSHCYQKLAIVTNNPWLCERATEGGTKTKCYIMMAEKTHNPAICNNIPDNSRSPQYTKEMCLQRVAQTTGRTDLCDEIGSYRAPINDLASKGYSKEDCYAAVQASGITSPLSPEKCGELDQPCCEEIPCKSENARCYNEKCIMCGYAEGDFCCEGDKCHSNMLSCKNDKCVKCGERDQICCPDNKCGKNYFGTQMKCIGNECKDCGYIGLQRCSINGVENCYEGTISEEGMCIS